MFLYLVSKGQAYDKKRKRIYNRKIYNIFSVNLYKEYTSLKSKELEELPRFRVMSWQLSQLLRFALNCFLGNSFHDKSTQFFFLTKELSYFL